MLDLARADPERERPQRAVRRGVTVAAYQRGARQREAQFGADDMDDALFGRGRVDIVDAEFGGVALERGQLVGALGVGDRQAVARRVDRSEEHTSELQSLMRISYAVFCLKKKKTN